MKQTILAFLLIITLQGFSQAIPINDDYSYSGSTQLINPCTGETINVTQSVVFKSQGVINKNAIIYTNAVQVITEGEGYTGHATYTAAFNGRFVAGSYLLQVKANGLLFGPDGKKYQLHWSMWIKTNQDGTTEHQTGINELTCLN